MNVTVETLRDNTHAKAIDEAINILYKEKFNQSFPKEMKKENKYCHVIN